MRVYVLGAGASFHAGFPLGAQLRRELEAWASPRPRPTSTLAPDFERRFSTLRSTYAATESLDSILTRLYERPVGSRADKLLAECPAFLADILGAFRQFFRELHLRQMKPQGSADYQRLANLIRPGDAIITFNYDLALERELKRAGRWEVSDGYGFNLRLGSTPPSEIKVLKLHGSINWYAAPTGSPGGVVVGTNFVGDRPVLCCREEWTYLGYAGLSDPAISNRTPMGSAMIMPVAHKAFYYETSLGKDWQGFWDCLWNVAASWLRTCDEILVIGYSLPSGDERARELLLSHANKNARVTVCCGKDSGRIQKELRSHGFTSFARAPVSFHDFVQGTGAEPSQ